MEYIRHTGFTLVELMIVVMIMGILSMLAIPVYVDYADRAMISSGLNLAATAKSAVTEYNTHFRKFPDSNSIAGIPDPQEIDSKYVKSVSIAGVPTPGTITITFKGSERIDDGSTVMLVPVDNYGSVSWSCTGSLKQLLPSNCR